jgi:hypothetical protein
VSTIAIAIVHVAVEDASAKLHHAQCQHLFTQVHLKDNDVDVDLSEFNCPNEHRVIVEPLTNENWIARQVGALKKFTDGVCVSHQGHPVEGGFAELHPVAIPLFAARVFT